MEVKGQTIILEAGEEVTIKAREKEVAPAPPSDEPKTDERYDLVDLILQFNNVLQSRGYNPIRTDMEVYKYLYWAHDYTMHCYDSGGADAWVFKESTYPLLYD